MLSSCLRLMVLDQGTAYHEHKLCCYRYYPAAICNSAENVCMFTLHCIAGAALSTVAQAGTAEQVVAEPLVTANSSSTAPIQAPARHTAPVYAPIAAVAPGAAAGELASANSSDAARLSPHLAGSALPSVAPAAEANTSARNAPAESRSNSTAVAGAPAGDANATFNGTTGANYGPALGCVPPSESVSLRSLNLTVHNTGCCCMLITLRILPLTHSVAASCSCAAKTMHPLAGVHTGSYKAALG